MPIIAPLLAVPQDQGLASGFAAGADALARLAGANITGRALSAVETRLQEAALWFAVGLAEQAGAPSEDGALGDPE